MARKPTPEPSDNESRQNRLVIPLQPDNSIDWEAMRASQKSQLLNVANNDVTILEHIGISHEEGGDRNEGEEVVGDITEANIKTFLDGISTANGAIFKMLAPRLISHPFKSQQAGRKIPLTFDADIIQQCFVLTDQQHEELDPRAMRLAQKYFPAAAKKHLDVYLLVIMFLKFQSDNAKNAIKFQLTRDLGKMRQAESPVSPSPPPVVPINGHAADTQTDDGGESLEPGAEPEA